MLPLKEGMAVAERSLQMNHTSPNTHLTHFIMDSTRFRHNFNSFSPFSTNRWFSSFSPQKFASYLSRGVLSLRAADPIFQTESKGNFCLMTLYSHKRRACHFAPPTATCRHFAPPLLPLPAKRSGEGWGEGYKPNSKGILSQCRYTDT
jgi:hypothetical protein